VPHRPSGILCTTANKDANLSIHPRVVVVNTLPEFLIIGIELYVLTKTNHTFLLATTKQPYVGDGLPRFSLGHRGSLQLEPHTSLSPSQSSPHASADTVKGGRLVPLAQCLFAGQEPAFLRLGHCQEKPSELPALKESRNMGLYKPYGIIETIRLLLHLLLLLLRYINLFTLHLLFGTTVMDQPQCSNINCIILQLVAMPMLVACIIVVSSSSTKHALIIMIYWSIRLY
jgi:hypothetical protein